MSRVVTLLLKITCQVRLCGVMTLKMTVAEAVETSVSITNSLSQDHTNLDDHISQTSIDTPRFKPFILYQGL